MSAPLASMPWQDVEKLTLAKAPDKVMSHAELTAATRQLAVVVFLLAYSTENVRPDGGVQRALDQARAALRRFVATDAAEG